MNFELIMVSLINRTLLLLLILTAVMAICGDGKRQGGETCDDGLNDKVGCNSSCTGTVKGWSCWGGDSTQRDVCVMTCKNINKLKTFDVSEICDDGNKR